MRKIGPSMPASTVSKKVNVSGTEPASFRYFNPGAQYPSKEAARFGQTGYGIIGGGHKIACFPSAVNGAAANLDLLNRVYVGMSIGAAGKKWTGAHGFGVPGYGSTQTLTREILADPDQAIAFLKAIAKRESGRGNNLTDMEWRQAHRMFLLGSADEFLAQTNSQTDDVPAEVAGPTGAGLVRRARQHIGEEYKSRLVPKNDPNWKGPWDCAELVSWLVYQEGALLYGCTDNQAPPARAEAYTGAWKNDVAARGIRIPVEEAVNIVGAIVLRYPPPDPGAMGHIAICDGKGGTIEAKGRRYGVVADKVAGRPWDTGVLIPGFTYEAADASPATSAVKSVMLYRRGAANMSTEIVSRIQQAVLAAGFDPGEIDGEYGLDTERAVIAFQEFQGLTVDGIVGPDTADALSISLDAAVAESDAVVVTKKAAELAMKGNPDEQSSPSSSVNVPLAIIALLLRRMSMNASSKVDGTSDPIRALLTALLQASLSGEKIDNRQLVLSLLNGSGDISQDSLSVGQPPLSRQPEDMLVRRLALMLTDGLHPDPAPPAASENLGPVNGALGEMVGKLLNGKKSAIGIIGSILTGIIGAAPSNSTVSDLVGTFPVFSGTSGMFLPIFLGMTIWGILGRLEKWKMQPK